MSDTLADNLAASLTLSAPAEEQSVKVVEETRSEEVVEDTRIEEAAEEMAPRTDNFLFQDLDESLQTIKARLAVLLSQEITGVNMEKVLLSELQMSAESLVTTRTFLNEKQAQLDALDADAPGRDTLEQDIDQLTSEFKAKQRRWDANKQVYGREYGVVQEETIEKLEKAKANKNEIERLQQQIAQLQEQLNSVETRRQQMLATTKEKEIGEDDE